MLPNRKPLYPSAWPKISHDCKRSAGWRCQSCKVRHGAVRISRRTGKPYSVWLHAAHVQFNDTLNPAPALKCLCPTCHGRYDYRLRVRQGHVDLERLKHKIRLRSRGVLAC
jgi:hypothetical protein